MTKPQRPSSAGLVAIAMVLGAALVLGLNVAGGGSASSTHGAVTEGAPAPEPPVLTSNLPIHVRQLLEFTKRAAHGDIHLLRWNALNSESPLIVGNALLALARLGAMAGDEELTALVRDRRLRVRQDAVQALGLSGDRSAVEALCGLLDDREPTVVPLVLQALGRIGGPRAVEKLTAVAEDPATGQIERVFAQTALASLDK